jgi:hypothetical protein
MHASLAATWLATWNVTVSGGCDCACRQARAWCDRVPDWGKHMRLDDEHVEDGLSQERQLLFLLGACVQPSQRYEYSGPSHANRWHIPRSTPLDSTAPFQSAGKLTETESCRAHETGRSCVAAPQARVPRPVAGMWQRMRNCEKLVERQLVAG